MSQHYADETRASDPHALYWYRAGDDPDLRCREHWQMSGGGDAAEVARQIVSLREQGYRVQRVMLQTGCAECAGIGVRYVRPKGMRRATAAKLPRWRLASQVCAACDGRGWTSEREMALPDVEVFYRTDAACRADGSYAASRAECARATLHRPAETRDCQSL